MLVPDTISRERYFAALAAFCEAVGLDPAVTCFPLILAEDAIPFSVIVPDDEGFKRLTRHDPGVGNAGSVLTAHGKIEVE